MRVPHGTLLDYTYNAAHADHVHVEPPTKMRGTPPFTNPGMSRGVETIVMALNKHFGPGQYFLDKNGRYVGNDPGVGWTHMGGWNRRPIAGTSSWSQHSYWNALDIGPYMHEAQDKFIAFLRGEDGTLPGMAFTPEQEKALADFADALIAEGSSGAAGTYMVRGIRLLRKLDEVFEGPDGEL